jgi:hypothetical protein
MKKILLASAALLAMAAPAFAQVTPAVLQLPVYLNNNVGQVYDFGNGPMEFKIVQGSAQLWTMQGSGTSQTVSASTSVTLNASAAANPPCIGCNIQSLGAAPGATSLTVASFNGTTGIGLSAAVSIISGTTLQWGVACPTSVGSNPVLNTQGGIINDLPFNTLARLCGASQFSAGGVVLPFAIGAH